MPQYSFRIRCNVPDRSGISWDKPDLTISPVGVHPRVRLTANGRDVPLSQAKAFIIRSDGYTSEEEARTAARRYSDALIRAFSRLRIAADFGVRAAKGGFTEAGLRDLEERSGHRILNDVHGVMVFPTAPSPAFGSVSGSGIRTPAKGDLLVQAVGDYLGRDWELSDGERLAYDLFSSSFSAATADARFLDLMMAVETLLDPKPRSQPVLAHVERLIAATRSAVDLPESERDSICGALAWLRVQSIGQAGRELASSLAHNRYSNMNPPEFFSACYGVRSRLVHGSHPRPTREEVGSLAANLELFVSHLLAR